jgi:hypothetical protein
MREIIGIVCPNCNQFVTDKLANSRNFDCKKCKLILEPPDGIRLYIECTNYDPSKQEYKRAKNREFPFHTIEPEVTHSWIEQHGQRKGRSTAKRRR